MMVKDFFKVLVTGGRDLAPGVAGQVWTEIRRYRDYHKDRLLVITGGARGVDEEARRACVSLNVWHLICPADWDHHGKWAGPKRNLEMLDMQPDLVLSFPGGVGTLHCTTNAEKRGIPVRRIERV